MAQPANMVWEIRTTGVQTSGSGFAWVSLVNATYKWTKSGSGTNEYYCQTAAGGNPGLTEAKCCTTDGTFKLDTNGTLGTLAAGEWDWGDNDALGYSTVYVRLDDDIDPDSKNYHFVQIGALGGYDYSQQNVPQLSLANVTTDATGTILSTVTGGSFTALMCANGAYITGGGTTPGWYEITVFTSGTQVTIDRSCGANKNTVTVNVGGAFKIGGSLDNDFWGSTAKTAGNKIFIKNGAYTLGETVSVASNGLLATPIIVEGYNVIRGDAPIGVDRPSIECTASYAWGNAGYNHWVHKNLIFSGSFTTVFNSGGIGWCENCKFTNSSGTADRIAASIGSNYHNFIHCEAICTNGRAITNAIGGVGVFVIGCYVHDSVTGIIGCHVINSVIDTCSSFGIRPALIAIAALIYGNTIYNCGVAISESTVNYMALNNIISGNTTGASSTTLIGSQYCDYNCWNNTTDVSKVNKGPNDITGDPLLNAPAGGDFTLKTGSPCFNAGLELGPIVGL